ncbi:dihydroorotate dehydrogenase (NAD+) catalytic subunit [Candidatus Nanopelagicus hibericus]|uniref:Dihydroorotate dehydrogenase n=1 Tax=Candidatus Nanopelagicus hibericus TaxID=1884915 RepID=A0A249KAX1_9ACTN|nr:dihydroorotate dehydrogenase [Candidatus Nanopelagicus hibericus]ASY13937.1 dihydroorotate dehydrogenase (NAD+) catalytic subunit [Candidatus Nanopelagicus hibericus]
MSVLDFSTKIGSKRFSNPIFTASGCASSGQELAQFFPLTELGAIVTKSIMTKPRTGRATPRMAETPSGMLNSIGLQGPGIHTFLERDIPWLVENKVKVIVSIAGETVDEYGVLARRLRAVAGISAVEVNISCPNVENRGQVFACHPESAVAVIEAVRRNIGGELPIVAKLSPDVTDIVAIAASVINVGVDGLALINTLLGMVIDTNTMKPKLTGKTGGLSGPAIRPIAVRAIYQVHQAFPNIPIVGMGGVSSGRDAFELVLAGASAISIGTANFSNPSAAINIKNELSALLTERGFNDFRDAIGFAHRGI